MMEFALYRVDLGWVDINFGYSTTCLGRWKMEVWQKGLWSWA